jgi:hypothetical protein
MISKHKKIVISALADLWARDLFSLVKRGMYKEAISSGVLRGLKKKDVKAVIKGWKV